MSTSGRQLERIREVVGQRRVHIDRQMRDGMLEGYKTTGDFDGTINNPHWLTTAKVAA